MNAWNHFVKDLFSSGHAAGRPWGDMHPMTWAAGIYQMVKAQEEDDEIVEPQPFDHMVDHNTPETLLIAMEDMDLRMDELLPQAELVHMDGPELDGPSMANGCPAHEYLVPGDLDEVGVARPIPLRRGVEPSTFRLLSLWNDMRSNYNRSHKGCNSKPRYISDRRRTAA